MTNIFGKIKMEPIIHISKRNDIEKWKAWLIRIGAGILALLVCAIVATIFTKDFGGFFASLFRGVFGTKRRIDSLFKDIAVLLCIALAVTPAFKMKFWNIGAEGQVFMGALMAVVCVQYIGDSIPNGALILIMFIAAVIGGAIWAVIPALFKAKWNTNETLFTLMMNYIAIQLVSICINSWDTTNHAQYGSLKAGVFPAIGGNAYIINIIFAVVMTIGMFIYLRFSKHGYELTVVGESINTAKYIGINVKKVIIRTMLLSGALCGVAGLMIVSGDAHTITTSVVGGRGFTAVLVSWLAHFSPVGMVLTSFLVIFISQGARWVSVDFDLGSATFADFMAGLFLFFIIACEFFINYKVKIDVSALKKYGRSKKENAVDKIGDDANEAHTLNNEETPEDALCTDKNDNADETDEAVEPVSGEEISSEKEGK